MRVVHRQSLSAIQRFTAIVALICYSTPLFSSNTFGSPSKFPFDSFRYPKQSNSGIPSLVEQTRSTGHGYKLNLHSNIVLDIKTTASTCSNATGSIIATASGGIAPYTFILYDGNFPLPPQSIGYYPKMGPATYLLKVKDSNGGSTFQYITVNNNLERPELEVAAFTPASDCGVEDATVTLKTTKGSAPYTYSLDLQNFQPGSTFSNLSDGRYIFYVKDANGCIDAYDYFEGLGKLGCSQPIGISYSYYVCQNEGVLNVTAFGSESPYTYSLNGAAFVNNGNFSSLTAGKHKVRVRDKDGKIYLYTIVLVQSCNLVVENVTTDAGCGLSNGSIQVTAKNGTPPYKYTIDGTTYQQSNIFKALAPGVYNVTIIDGIGETNSMSALIADNCPDLTLTQTAESCAGNDGSITATGSKGSPPYQYALGNGSFQASNIFSNLLSGNYAVKIKDAGGFLDSAAITVNKNCLSLSVTPSHVICTNHNGSVTVTVSGGTPPYLYSSNGVEYQNNNVLTGLGPGDYTITVRDRDGKLGSIQTSIFDQPGPHFVAEFDTASCNNNDGSIRLHTVGGLPPYTYSLNNIDYQTSSFFPDLYNGHYHGYIKDANGCVWDTGLWVPINCLALQVQTKHSTCGSNNGNIGVTASGGIAPYEYSIDDVSFNTSGFFENLGPGIYTLTAKGADGQTRSEQIAIKNACIAIDATVIDATCGISNGTIDIKASQGIPPYFYSIDGNNFQSGTRISNLPAGLYTITIKDSIGITRDTTLTIANNPGPQLNTTSHNASCLNNDGKINVSVKGGTKPYQFSINGATFQDDSVFSNLSAGQYTIYIRDQMGSSSNYPVSIYMTNNLVLDIDGQFTICEGKSVTINAQTNGQSISWLPKELFNNVNGSTVSMSPATPTKIYVKAKLGVCDATDSSTIYVNPAPIATAQSDTIICFGQSTSITGKSGVSYLWAPSTYLDNSNAQAPTVIRPQSTIQYSLTVTDQNNCSSLNTATVTVVVTPPAKLSAGNDTSIVMNQDFQLLARDLNNSGFINYSWFPNQNINSPSIQNPTINLTTDMTYTVRAWTAAGCEGEDEINIKVYKGPEIYVPNVFTPNNDGRNEVLTAHPVGIRKFNFLTIFDRWGKTVFYTSDPRIGWNATHQGKYSPAGTYVWIASGVDGNEKLIIRKGTVTIIR